MEKLANGAGLESSPQRGGEIRSIEERGGGGDVGGLELPSSVMRGVLGDAVRVLAPSTEASPAFLFGALYSVVGLLFGRRFWVVQGRRIYPNVMGVLVGESARARKSTAIALVREHILSPLLLEGPRFSVVSGRTTGEGLLDAVCDIENGATGRMVLIIADEFASFFRKARQQMGSTLGYQMMELADMQPTIDLKTRKKSARASDYFFALIGATTFAALERDLDPHAVDDGLVNRLTIFVGQPSARKPRPPVPDEAALREIKARLAAARDRRDAGELRLDPDATRMWDEWYMTEPFRAIRLHDGATARIEAQAARGALIFALCDGSPAITCEHVKAGIDLATYSAQAVTRVLDGLAENEAARTDERILKAIARHRDQKGEWPTLRELRARLSGAVDAERLRRSLAALEECEALILIAKRYAIRSGSPV